MSNEEHIHTENAQKANKAPAFTRWFMCAIAVPVFLMTLFVTPGDLPQVTACRFREFTGLPCPGCGLTRSVFAIGNGDFSLAWALNPFGYMVYAALLILILMPLLHKLSPKTARRIEHPKFINAGVMFFFVGVMVFGLARLTLAIINRS